MAVARLEFEDWLPYSEQLFGVPSQALVGARAAGEIRADSEGRSTKRQVAAGVKRYMATPVTVEGTQ